MKRSTGKIERERYYVLRLADDFRDGGGRFRENGRGIDAVEANVG